MALSIDIYLYRNFETTFDKSKNFKTSFLTALAKYNYFKSSSYILQISSAILLITRCCIVPKGYI